jgi:hypothetical protein
MRKTVVEVAPDGDPDPQARRQKSLDEIHANATVSSPELAVIVESNVTEKPVAHPSEDKKQQVAEAHATEAHATEGKQIDQRPSSVNTTDWNSVHRRWIESHADPAHTNTEEEHFDDDGKYSTEATRRAHHLGTHPAAASCYEALVSDFPGCSGYEDCGYHCFGQFCASTWPTCDFSVCANAIQGGHLNKATGRCVGGRAKTLGSGNNQGPKHTMYRLLHDLDGSTLEDVLDDTLANTSWATAVKLLKEASKNEADDMDLKRWIPSRTVGPKEADHSPEVEVPLPGEERAVPVDADDEM